MILVVKMKKVLLIDGRSLATLAIARSLGRKGFEIHCGDDFKHNITAYSKFVKKRVIYTSHEKNPDAFIFDILKIIKQENYEILISAQDETTHLLSKHKNEISKYTNLYLADFNIFNKFFDKGKTIKIAQKAGIPTPKTYFPEDTNIETIKEKLEYPVLIRSRISSGSRGMKLVNASEDFDKAYGELKINFGEPIIQEYIEKKGYSTACILLDEEQNEIASFSYKRLKEYPLSGGPTVVAISDDDTLTKKYSINLLKTVGWKGVAEVEYILNQNNDPLLLEVNPRFWMPLNHAIDSGVDFPYLLYKLATKKHAEPVKSYKIGVKYRWILPNEILWLISAPKKLEGFKDFINFWEPNISFGIFSLKDPMPIIGTIAQSLYFLTDSDRRKSVLGREW